MLAKREQNRLDQRNRIGQAALKLFSERGFDDVTMADVAAEAGVARATVFNHFRSKYALVESITEDVLTYYHGMLDRALDDATSSTPALVRALFGHMGFGIEQSSRFYRSVFREIAKVQIGLDEGGVGQRAREGALGRLVRLFERGQKRGDICPDHDTADLSTAFDSLVFGTITHWLYDDASEPLEGRMLRAAAVFLCAVTPHPIDPSEPLPDISVPDLEEWESSEVYRPSGEGDESA